MRNGTLETSSDAAPAMASEPDAPVATASAVATTTLYIACHNTNPGLAAPPFKAIHVGRARGGRPLPGTIGDDRGDNISQLNDRYCELTGIYWAWKNDRTSSHVGLMHYRRFLDFTGEHASELAENFVPEFDILGYEKSAADWLAAHLDEYDIILPQAHQLKRTVRGNYSKAHHEIDLDICREIIAADCPDLLEAYDRTMEGKALFLANMFVMRRRYFEDYCAWIFPILAKLEADERGKKPMTVYQNRRIGFIAERLFTVYMFRLIEAEPSLRIRQVNIVNTSKALVSPVVDTKALNAPGNVNIAFSSDLNFLAHTAAMVNSLKRHADPETRYNLFYLYSEIPPDKLEVFEGILADAPNMKITSIDVGNRFADAYRSAVRAPSNATYNRFLLFDLLAGLDRLLYLDVDMIALGDVAEIFHQDIGDAQIAAVPDYIMTRGLCVKARLRSKVIEDLATYQREELKMNDEQIAKYFNAGLLLFNFKAMGDVRKVGRELMDIAFSGEYFFRDQDILNSYFRDSYFKLPGRYNVFNSLTNRYARIPVENYREAMAAKRSPLIVHYASAEFKPWSNPDVHFGQHYWNSLRETPFHQEVLLEFMRLQIEQRYSFKAKRRAFLEGAHRAIKRFLPF